MSGSVAKYLRVSAGDGDLNRAGKTESNSISNQRDLIDGFIRRTPELAGNAVVEFCDDGWSGKNFDRPAVREMIEQARAGKIRCIVVKDLSRFGRDHLTVGSYLAHVFPFLGVRFIAVNDGIDTSRAEDRDSLETSFRALVYDLYSRDLSRKVRSAARSRAERGAFLAPYAPYGYRKDPADRSRLLIDPEAADTVRRIFRMAAEGHPAERIARVLNGETVPTPMLYKRSAGCSRAAWTSVGEENFWTRHTVAEILRDERYTGRNVFGRRRRDRTGHTHTVKVSREDWITVDNAHEAVVSQEEFTRAQAAMRAFAPRDAGAPRGGILAGRMRCGVCGFALVRSRGKRPYYFCATPRLTGSSACPAERVPEADVEELVQAGLWARAGAAADMERVWEEQRRRAEQAAAAWERALAERREALARQKRRVRELYEAFFAGETGREAYLAQKAAAAKEREALCAGIAALEAEAADAGDSGCLQDRLAAELAGAVLSEVRVYPGGRLEIVWNYREEWEKAALNGGIHGR